MARSPKRGLQFDLRPAIEHLGLDFVLEQIGVEKLIQHIKVEDWMAKLTPAQRRELNQAEFKKLLQRLKAEDLVAYLTPAQRRRLKRLLQEEPPSGK